MDAEYWNGEDKEWFDNYNAMQKRELAKKKNEGQYRQNSKQRMAQGLEKRFKTTMIGALARFEESFGYLWGHNKEGRLTTEEKEFRRVWDETRNQILTNGNNQLRASLEEIANYDIKWNRYNTNFIVKPYDRRNDNE